MKRYVVGFMFDPQRSEVLLIQKLQPEWQRGRWNGIGGHIEEGELAVDAMRREFLEETGVVHKEWELVVKMMSPHAEIYFYRAFSTAVQTAKTTTAERVMRWGVALLPDTITNLRWLIPMCLHEKEGKNLPYVIQSGLWD